jgi:hypothetical protein
MEESRVAWVTRQPAPALARLIDGYVGYRMSGFAGSTLVGATR